MADQEELNRRVPEVAVAEKKAGHLRVALHRLSPPRSRHAFSLHLSEQYIFSRPWVLGTIVFWQT